jgi:hypothetical protein
MILLAVVAVLAVVGVLSLVVLTVLGARRRGHADRQSWFAGFLFPVTWTIWYVRDERPYRRVDRRLG